jgi:hypothetical protein
VGAHLAGRGPHLIRAPRRQSAPSFAVVSLLASKPKPQRSPLVRYFDRPGISGTPDFLVVRVKALNRLSVHAVRQRVRQMINAARQNPIELHFQPRKHLLDLFDGVGLLL